MDRNSPANAEDMGSIPGLGRFHMPLGQLSLRATTTEAGVPGACAPQLEKLLQRSPCTTMKGRPPVTAAREGLCAATKTQHNDK